MKKFQKLLVITLAILLFNIANALEIVDVKANHWAGQEIVHAIQNGYIYVIDENKFKPDDPISRSDFVTALLKVIRRQNDTVEQDSTFKDIKNTTSNKRSVVLSEQIKMAFGYPDKTFKPEVPINHNETMSMIANITKGSYEAGDITAFKDYNSIPLWARRAYIKNVANGFYVNHPDALTFNPSNNLTRAEAAVLFDIIASNLDKFEDKYKDLYDTLPDNDNLSQNENNDSGFNKSSFISDNTLNLAPFAQNKKVSIYDNKKIIAANNILIGTSLNQVKARKDLVGQEYAFVAPNDVYSQEGTFLYPKGTEFYARVEKLGYSAWRSKSEKSNVVFHKYSLPDGQTYDMAGVPFTKDNKIVYVKNIIKPRTVKALNATEKSTQKQLINTAHQRSPILDYKLKDNKTIYILLTADMVIPQNEEYMNLRTKKSILEEDI